MFTGDPYTQDTVTVLEKIAIQTQLYLAIDTIQDALATLARNVKRWTRRDVWEYAGYIEDLVDQLLHRTAVLTEPRHVPIKAMMRKGPKLASGATYGEWRPYILGWLDIIETALDRAGLLVTDVVADIPWSPEFLGEIREKTLADAQRVRVKEE